MDTHTRQLGNAKAASTTVATTRWVLLKPELRSCGLLRLRRSVAAGVARRAQTRGKRLRSTSPPRLSGAATAALVSTAPEVMFERASFPPFHSGGHRWAADSWIFPGLPSTGSKPFADLFQSTGRQEIAAPHANLFISRFRTSIPQLSQPGERIPQRIPGAGRH